MEENEQAEFGRAFIKERQFQLKYEQIQAQRRVHAGAIYRERGQLSENRAVEMPKGVLEVRLSNLHNNYAGFVNEHKALLALIVHKDKAKRKDQENYAVQVEKDYLLTAGELQGLINDKDFFIKAAQLEESNRMRFGQPTVSEVRVEMSKRAETVLSDARQELAKIRAEKNVQVQEILPHGSRFEPQPSGSGIKGSERAAKPLRQLMEECGLDSDTDLDENAPSMSDSEINNELKRYDSSDNIAGSNCNAIQSPGNEDEYVPMPKGDAKFVKGNYIPTPKHEPKIAEAMGSCPKSAVKIVNRAEHDDLRGRIKGRPQPLHYGSVDRSAPYQKRWTPNREISCFNCGGWHAMSKCQLFDELQPVERRTRVRNLNLCENCFSPLINEYNRPHICRSGICRRCQRGYHNSKLCEGK